MSRRCPPRSPVRRRCGVGRGRSPLRTLRVVGDGISVRRRLGIAGGIAGNVDALVAGIGSGWMGSGRLGIVVAGGGRFVRGDRRV